MDTSKYYQNYLCRFLKHPEYLKVGAKLLFREGVTKGIGHVTDVQAIAAGEAQANMGF